MVSERSISKKYLDELTYQIIGAAIEVHKRVGPGLLESVYHTCLKREFELRNIPFESEKRIQIVYKGIVLETELRCDFDINRYIVVEIKAVETIIPLHEAQLLTYMNLLEVPKGILINFNCSNIFKEGQTTFVNELYSSLPEE